MGLDVLRFVIKMFECLCCLELCPMLKMFEGSLPPGLSPSLCGLSVWEGRTEREVNGEGDPHLFREAALCVSCLNS